VYIQIIPASHIASTPLSKWSSSSYVKYGKREHVLSCPWGWQLSQRHYCTEKTVCQ